MIGRCLRGLNWQVLFRTPEAPFAISLYMMFFSSPKFVPGKHATMITQEGISPSIITNWAISLRGLVIWDIENNDAISTVVKLK
jgi:hypothetical protein